MAEPCQREGIAQSLSKEPLEAGKKRRPGDTERETPSSQVKKARRGMSDLKEAVLGVLLENRLSQ